MEQLKIKMKIDTRGRIALPVKIRNMAGINIKDNVEMYVHNENIIMEKYKEQCIFCYSEENLINYKEKNICKFCINELRSK